MKTLTQERLMASLRYDPETGVFLRLPALTPVGWVGVNGYRETTVHGVRFYEHRLAWLYMHGKLPSHYIDHINGNRADNRIANLREADNSQNVWNSCVFRTNTSGYKGVTWDQQRKKWYAYINFEGRMRSLGRHDTLEDAVQARMAAQERLFGEFARAA